MKNTRKRGFFYWQYAAIYDNFMKVYHGIHRLPFFGAKRFG